ncbi:MAG: hypothetical protein NT126_01780 [Bacteroidetes bacterium]|nr:hypothetical protein [Bacteroidota bacterium]
MKKLILLLFVGAWCVSPTYAQSDAKESPRDFGSNKLLITGHATVTAVMDSGQNNISEANFSAIFLYHLSEKLFLESELEIATGEGSAELGLEHANLVWMFNKNIAFHAGRFVPHFGLYRGRLGEGFINRFPTDPAGFGDGGIGTMEAVGFGFQGGFALGVSKMNYDLWVSDGPHLLTDIANAGQFDYEAYKDNNKNKAVGGRIGFLPFTNSCLELGLSFENTKKTGDLYSPFENVGVRMMAVDFNFYHQVSPLMSTIRLTGEYKKQDVDKFDYPVPYDSTGAIFTFDNSSNAYYVSASIRPSSSENEILRNFEIAYRYSKFTTPKEAPWGTAEPVVRNVVALNYWLKWNCVLKVAFQKETNVADAVYVQMFYGF